MRIVGLDVSLTSTGVAVCEDDLKVLHLETIRPGRGPLPARLQFIYDRLRSVIQEFSPEVAVVESVIYHRNPSTAIALGSARGVVLLLLSQMGLTVEEISPTAAKLSVAGNGRASKQQVQFMIRALFGLRSTPNDHESDALALIYTYLNRKRSGGLRHKG